jgi:hypothetical protein
MVSNPYLLSKDYFATVTVRLRVKPGDRERNNISTLRLRPTDFVPTVDDNL